MMVADASILLLPTSLFFNMVAATMVSLPVATKTAAPVVSVFNYFRSNWVFKVASLVTLEPRL